jgi:hypothetical protein
MEVDNVQDRIWHYSMDTEGHLWHDGAEFEDPQVLKFFMRKMEKQADGKFKVICQGETCYIEPQDVPYVVQKINFLPDKIELIFQGDYREALDPISLYVGKDNVLYCKVRGGNFNARFNRKPYLELAHQIEHDPKHHGFCLIFGGKSYPIQGVHD